MPSKTPTKAAKPAARKAPAKKAAPKKPAAKKNESRAVSHAPVKSPAADESPLIVQNVETLCVDDHCVEIHIQGRFDREAAIGLAKRVQRAVAELY